MGNEAKRKKVSLIFLFLLIFFLLLLCTASCNTVDPPPDKAVLTLTLEDVSCTEAWITLTTNNLQVPATLNLLKDNNITNTINLQTADTLLYIDSLLPNQTYQYQATSIQNPATSNELSVTTLDTTTQNFSFEIFEFGDGFSSSYFNDVWIFDENNIWAVGYISPEDTIINGTHIINPNIMRWDGVSWKIIPYSGTSSGIDGIWALNTSLIYFASGGIRKYENGVFSNVITNLGLTNGQRIEKLWGSSENNIYGVGPWGTIVWYNGVKWTKIEFDTQWYFYQITGNQETGVAYAVARNSNHITIIVELNNSMPEIIYNSQNNAAGYVSWTIQYERRKLLLSSGNIWSFIPTTKEVSELTKLPVGLGILTIGSYGSNEIYYYGDEGGEARLVHFNGIVYKIFNIPQIDPDNYGGIDVIKNLAVSVGFANNKAYLIKIRRD